MTLSLMFADDETGAPLFARSDLDHSIIHRFEAIVAANPQRIAIRSNSHGIARHITYDELNCAANSIALALRERVGAEPKPVALMCDQDDRAIAALLGVLKAGNFYVPLDSSYPKERLTFILKDCEPSILIADAGHTVFAKHLVPSSCAVACTEELISGEGRKNPASVTSPDTLAALFYTSGSTGRPKGVMQTHANVLHRSMVDTNTFRITAEDRVSLLSSASYSASLRQLFGALLNGAQLCPFNVAKEGLPALAEWLCRERITLYFSVPAVFRQLVAILNGAEDFRSLRLIKLGGESVTPADFELYRRHMPASCLFVNSLGSNETGVMRMFVADKTTSLLTNGTVPVGYEIEDKEVLILGDDGRRLGPDELGEIAVRSAFLSPGYWRQPALTASVFRSDPSDPRQRIYMTGDLGSLSADGCLTHKGRKDFRAKIRGVRVEVEEVEATLSQHPSVRQAVVSTHHDQAGQHRLLAYIVLRPGAQETDAEMRAFLLRRLPDPMIPSGFVFVDALPLSPHGKVDRHALPLPNATRPRRDPNAFALPADELEQTLIRMCETVLKVQPIGKDENLFDLGIDSLTVLRLIAEIERKFEKHLPPAALFSTPTITELAVLLRNEPIRSWSSLVPIQTTGNKPPFFWIHGDYSSVPLSRALGPDQPFYVLEHQAQDGTTAAFTRVETIAGYYLNEIQKVQVEGPYYIGGYSFGGVVALEVAQRMIKLGEQVGLVALLDPPTVAKESGRSSQGSVAVGEARASAHEAFRRHFDNLTALPAGERMAYLQPRARNKVVKMLKLALIERFAKRLTYRTCLALGYRLPVLVRSQYILDIYGRARRAYAAQAYSGRVILFKGEARRYNPQSDWEDLMVGDLDVHVVNANHAQIREEAYVHLWANTLKQALTQAQVHASLTTPDLRVGT